MNKLEGILWELSVFCKIAANRRQFGIRRRKFEGYPDELVGDRWRRKRNITLTALSPISR